MRITDIQERTVSIASPRFPLILCESNLRDERLLPGPKATGGAGL